MENREVIETTVNNMKSLYRDIGEIIQIIEENMENQNFKPFGMDNDLTGHPILLLSRGRVRKFNLF